MRDVAVARRNLEKDLKRGFESGEFQLFYQPQFTSDGKILTGAEALLRWNHPERGLLTPAAFIDILGSKPSAPIVGEWILRTACIQISKWRTEVPNLRVSVNLFESQLRNGSLIFVIKDIIRETGIPAKAIELEIVENILFKNDTFVLDLLRDLRRIGVRLAFDDYGTGYASLSLLKRYPVTRLKIDKSFIQKINEDAENQALVRAILYLGKSFGLEVIAEGVEMKEQLAFLHEIKCQEAQGFYLGEPVSKDEFYARFIKKYR